MISVSIDSIDGNVVLNKEQSWISTAFNLISKSLENNEKNKKDLLEVYFRDIIIKDIVQRYNIKDVNKLNDLAKYYLANISSLQSFNNIKNVLKLNLDTVERFSYYFSSVFLLNFVKKFSYSEKEQILNPRKVYCADNGLRGSVAFVFSEDYIIEESSADIIVILGR